MLNPTYLYRLSILSLRRSLSSQVKWRWNIRNFSPAVTISIRLYQVTLSQFSI